MKRVVKAGGQVRMTLAERERAIKLLDEILERTGTVRFELHAVARRQELLPSSWSKARLDALTEAAKELTGAFEKAPLSEE